MIKRSRYQHGPSHFVMFIALILGQDTKHSQDLSPDKSTCTACVQYSINCNKLASHTGEVAILLLLQKQGKNSCSVQYMYFDSKSSDRTRPWLLYLLTGGFHLVKVQQTHNLYEILTATQSLVRTILGPDESMKMCLKSSDRRSL